MSFLRRKTWLSQSFVSEDSGNALIEFCVVMPLLVFMLIAAVDCSFLTQKSMMVADAATSGTRYGSVAGNGSDTVGMQAAAVSAAAGLPNFTATATVYCTCTNGGSVVSCTATCASGYNPIKYDKVVASTSAPLFFKVNGLSGNVALTSTSTMRVVWQ